MGHLLRLTTLTYLSSGVAAANPRCKSDWLASELGPAGVTINAIAPGALNTARGDKARSPQFIDSLRAVTPLKPLGEPDDVVGALLFLVSDAAAWITGEIIRADGGWVKSVL